MNNFIFLITLSYLFGAEFKSERQHRIEQQLHAPCCWGGVIAEHDSPKAESIKAIIKNLIDENFDLKLINSSLLATYGNRNILDLAKNNIKEFMTDDEIIEFFVMIHGEKIRALPENKGLGWLAWNLPTFLLFSSLVTAFFIVKKLTKTTKSTSIIINNQQKKIVDKAMRDIGI